jgi:hypothetical protein
MRTISALWIALCSLAGLLPAQIVQVNYTATLATVGGNPFGLTSAADGLVLTGYFRYDTATPNTNTSSSTGDYQQTLSTPGFTGVLSGSTPLTITGSSMPSIEIVNTPTGGGDSFRFTDGPGLTTFKTRLMSVNGTTSPNVTLYFYIASGSQSVISSDALPLTFPWKGGDSINFPNTFAISDGSASLLFQLQTVSTQTTLTIDWPVPAAIVTGTPLSAAQLNASVVVPGTFVYTPPAGTVLPVGNHQQLSVSFTPDDSVDYEAVTATNYIDVATAPINPGVPFGSFDSPAANSKVNGSVGFTGWALSDFGITAVDLWREDSGNLVYIGDADFVPGSRPDVQSQYPNYPGNGSAGWGYLLLTNELPGANGTFTIHAIAHDTHNAAAELGVKTIIVDNADATQPFGAIDTPTQGGTVSGTNFVNFGWVLTPQPNIIPVDGSTIWVYIDSVPMGHPVYNNYRSDIATLFPGLQNSMGAVGYFYIDTTQLTNGLHTISWVARDSAGNAQGIGSRYFTVQN